MNTLIQCGCLGVCWLVLTMSVQAQQTTAQSAYEAAFSHDHLLQNGKVYGYLYPKVEGKHFISDSHGSLRYNGINFPKVDLHYDLYNDLVFVKNFQAGAERFIILRQPYVDQFRIGSLQFIRLRETPDTTMVPGVYQVAFDQGEFQLYVRKRVELDENPSSLPGGTRAEFLRADVYYLITPTGTHILNNKRDLYEALGDEKAIKAFVKSQNMFINPKQEAFTGQLVRILNFWVDR